MKEENNKLLIPAMIIAIAFIVIAIAYKFIDYYMLNKTIDEMSKVSVPKVEYKKPVLIKSEKVWIPGMSLKECMKLHGNELNESVVQCRNGYYTSVKEHYK